MKFLLWCCGVMVILEGAEMAWALAPGWKWVWIAAAVYWFLAGVVAGASVLVKTVTGRMNAGVGPSFTRRQPPTPAPHKEG